MDRTKIFYVTLSFTFVTATSFEETEVAIQDLRFKSRWWAHSRTTVIFTLVNTGTSDFCLERAYRNLTTTVEGHIKRDNGIFTEVSGQARTPYFWFLFVALGFVVLFLLWLRLEWYFSIILAIPLLAVLGSFFMALGLIVAHQSNQGVIHDIKSAVGFKEGPEPVHKSVRKKKHS